MREDPLLRRLERVSALPPSARKKLHDLLSRQQCVRSRQKLVPERTGHDAIYVALSGWFLQYRQLRSGERQVLSFHLPGEVIGLDHMIHGGSVNAVSALTDGIIATISVEEFEELQSTEPQLACAFLLDRLSDFAIQNEWILSLGRRTALQRIAHFLLEVDYRISLSSCLNERVRLFPFTQQDIADCTGLTVPYVNRILKELRRRGLAKIERGHLELLNPPALREVAGFQDQYLTGTRCSGPGNTRPMQSFAIASVRLHASSSAQPH